MVAGDDYSDLISSGYMLTGNIIGYTIDCNSTTDGELIVMIPDGISTISSTTILLTSQFATSSPSQIVGYYVQPVKIVGPSASGGEQGYWVDPELPEPQIGDVLGISNVCLFTASSSIISKCGYTRNIYVYYDNVDKFYFVSLYTFGRSVTSKVIGIAFETEENSCGLNLVPIRELYKDRVGVKLKMFFSCNFMDEKSKFMCICHVPTGKRSNYITIKYSYMLINLNVL